MFTHSHVYFDKSRQFLAAAATTDLQQLNHGHHVRQQEQHEILTSARSLSCESTFQRGGSLLTADPSVPFSEFLRNLSESLRRSAKMYPLKTKMDEFHTNLESEVGQAEPDSSSSGDKEKHKIKTISGNELTMDGKRIYPQIDARTRIDNYSKEMSKELPKGSQKSTRRYFIRDILENEATNQAVSYSCNASFRPSEPVLPVPEFTFYGPGVPTYTIAAYQQRNANQLAPWSSYDARNSYQECSVWHYQRSCSESVHRVSGIGYFPDDTHGHTSSYSIMTNSTHQSDSTTSNLNLRSGKNNRLTDPNKCCAVQRSAGAPIFKGSLHKRYTCDVCHKAFSRSNTLLTHKRIHTGDKPFSCDVCGRAFRQPGNLTRHRLTHSAYKPFVCHVCRKAFNRASNLNTHLKTHPGYFTSFNSHATHAASKMRSRQVSEPMSWIKPTPTGRPIEKKTSLLTLK